MERGAGEVGGSSGPPPPVSAITQGTSGKSMSVFVWQPSDDRRYDGGGGTGPTIRIAVGLIVLAFVFIVVSFSTPAWLETDGLLERPKFIRIGLWEGCFDRLQDDGHKYDNVISGCWNLLAEELYHLNELIFQHYPVTLAHRPPPLRHMMDDYLDNYHPIRRTMSGRFGLGIFVLAVILITIAFSTPYWLESDPRIVGAKFEKLGLWTHCFRSLPDPYVQSLSRFYSGCRWIFDPFTTGYSELRGYLVPPFFVAVQFFFTICFILLLMCCILVPMYLLCFGPDHQYYVLLIKVIGMILIFSGFLGTIAVIVFGVMGDSRAWMPDWQNNYLSWSFALGVVGVVCEYVAGILFLVEGRVQSRKRKFRESQSAYTMETKA